MHWQPGVRAAGSTLGMARPEEHQDATIKRCNRLGSDAGSTAWNLPSASPGIRPRRTRSSSSSSVSGPAGNGTWSTPGGLKMDR